MAWTNVASAADVAEGDVVGIQVAEKDLALYRQDGQYFATDNICTHQYARLSEGYFEDGCIECPLHQGRFDVRTGRAMCAPVTTDIKTYPIRVENGDLFADL
jgi:nitrite reductase/ring-hydroxylating ferredoxin subunit